MSGPLAATPARRALVAVPLTCALLLPLAGCNDDDKKTSGQSVNATSSATPNTSGAPSASASPTFEKQRLAKTRFVANASLAAGAAYQWVVKPFKAGKFKKGADGRKFALVKAGLAGAFTYNRLKAAVNNAKGDPTLSKAVAPLDKGIESLKGLSGKLAAGSVGAGEVGLFEKAIGGIKDAGRSAGAEVTDKVPSAGELAKGGSEARLPGRPDARPDATDRRAAQPDLNSPLTPAN